MQFKLQKKYKKYTYRLQGDKAQVTEWRDSGIGALFTKRLLTKVWLIFADVKFLFQDDTFQGVWGSEYVHNKDYNELQHKNHVLGYTQSKFEGSVPVFIDFPKAFDFVDFQDKLPFILSYDEWSRFYIV